MALIIVRSGRLSRRETPGSSGWALVGGSLVPRFLSYDFRGVGVRFGPEFGDPSVEHLRDVEVAVLIGRERMRPVELARRRAAPAPSVQVVAIQVVFQDAVGPAVGDPDVLVGRDEMVVRQ